LLYFMREYPYILGASKECWINLVQKYWFLSKWLGFSLSNSWNNNPKGWEFSNVKFRMVLLLWWPNYHVSEVTYDIRVHVPKGFKWKKIIVFCMCLFMGNVQVKLLWYVGIVRGERGMTSWAQEKEIWPLETLNFIF
jgi:hypothetical protein